MDILCVSFQTLRWVLVELYICYCCHNDFTGVLGQNSHLTNVPGVNKVIISVYRGAVNSVVTTTIIFIIRLYVSFYFIKPLSNKNNKNCV